MIDRLRRHRPIPKTRRNMQARALLQGLSRRSLEFRLAHRLCHHARRRGRLEGTYQDAFAAALATVRRLRRPFLETYYGLCVHVSNPCRLFVEDEAQAPAPRRRLRLQPRA